VVLEPQVKETMVEMVLQVLDIAVVEVVEQVLLDSLQVV
jgi:hypothetical protein